MFDWAASQFPVLSSLALVASLGTAACDAKSKDEASEAANKEGIAARGGKGAGGDAAGGEAGAEDAAEANELEADRAGLVFTVSGPQLPETVTFHVPNDRVTPYIGTSFILYNGGKLMSSPIEPEGGGVATLRSFTFEVKGAQAGTFGEGKFDLSMSIDVGTDDDINLGEDPKGTVELSVVNEARDQVVGELDVTVGDSGHDHDGVRYEVKGTVRSSKAP